MRSFEDDEPTRVDAERPTGNDGGGSNEVRDETHERSDIDDDGAHDPSDSSSMPAALPAATDTATSGSSGSDFMMLMRLLAEDRQRLAGDSRILTGGDSSAPTDVAFDGDHIRVDDSFGFAPDPFAPEANRPRHMMDDDDENVDDSSARVRVIGDADDGDEEDDDDPSVNASSRPDSTCPLTEEDAGASLESEPVADDYRYDAEADKMSMEEFRAQRSQGHAQIDAPQTTDATTQNSPSATSDHAVSSGTAATATDDSNSVSARASSRLAADLVVASRTDASNVVATDAVEAFSYQPQPEDSDEEGKQAGDEATSSARQAAMHAIGEAAITQRATASLVADRPTRAQTRGQSNFPASFASARTSTQSDQPRRVHRPHTHPADGTSSAVVGDDASVTEEIESVSLDDVPSTSVPILAHASDQAGSDAVKVRFGNFLGARDQMGFEEPTHSDTDTDDEEATDAAKPTAGEEASDDDDWLDVASLTEATRTEPAAGYVPSASERQRRPRARPI